MATGTRNKRTIQQEVKAKLSSRLNQQAHHLASLLTHVDTIASAKQHVGEDIEALKHLGMTMTEIEETTGISVYQLRTFTREARQNNSVEEEEAGTRESPSLEDSDEGKTGHQEQDSAELNHPDSNTAADTDARSEFARS